jgi:phosphoribosylanthranilate isomerase
VRNTILKGSRPAMRIKICGITNAIDAEQCARLSVDAVGLNLYAKSPRYIDPTHVAAVFRVLPASVEPVAVLVSPSPQELLEQYVPLGFRTLQLHAVGTSFVRYPLSVVSPLLTTENGQRTKDKSHEVRVILAAGVRESSDLEAVRNTLGEWKDAGIELAGVLIDARVEGQHGGTGAKAPWHLIADFKPEAPLYLAGGLTPENVAEAIRVVRPDAVDVASGVESSPGKKNLDKLRRFVENAREAGAKLTG